MKKPDFLKEVAAKVTQIKTKKGKSPYHSPHEGYGFMAEEFAELLDEIRQHHPRRRPNHQRLRSELVDIVAIAVIMANQIEEGTIDQ